MSLASMLKDKVEAWVEVDGFPGFSVKLAYLSRAEIERVRKKASKTKFDRRTHVQVEETDSDLFVKLLSKAAILGWKGLTLEYAIKLVPIDVPAEAKLSDDVPFSEEDAYTLVKESPEFDRWLNDTIFDLEAFRKPE